MAKGLKVQDGLVVHLDLGNNRHVVLAEKMRWTLDGSSFEAVGIDYRDLDIIVLKDRVHHRAFWDSVTKTNIRTSVPGQGPSDLSTLRYENAPDDAYPIGKRWRE
jgi:microcystin degradation protein MlrC